VGLVRSWAHRLEVVVGGDPSAAAHDGEGERACSRE